MNVQVDLIARQEGIMAFNKPAGIISEGPMDGRPELWQLVKHIFPASSIAHRIDKMTSGIVLFGATQMDTNYLRRNWHSITKKRYLAIIKTPRWTTATVDTPLEGKSAVTQFTVLESVGATSLVLCELVQNGRTHQIRKHLQSIRSSIIGDTMYGGRFTEARYGQLLHAWQVEVILPSGKVMQVQAPIPPDFRAFMPDFNWNIWDQDMSATLWSWDMTV